MDLKFECNTLLAASHRFSKKSDCHKVLTLSDSRSLSILADVSPCVWAVGSGLRYDEKQADRKWQHIVVK